MNVFSSIVLKVVKHAATTILTNVLICVVMQAVLYAVTNAVTTVVTTVVTNVVTHIVTYDAVHGMDEQEHGGAGLCAGQGGSVEQKREDA